MADNVIADSGDSGGATFATDDVGGVHYPLTKIALGALDANDGPVASGNPMPVAGTVTANLSATDNAVLDAIAVSVAVMDDWDESDRAKANIIVGQAGIAAGAGAVAANAPRVTLASDDPAVALLGTIDADTGAIKTAVELIDNAVAVEGAALGSGILLQGDDGTDRTNVLVDTDGHLQVDVLTGGGGGTQYSIDDAGPVVVTMSGTIRDDVLTTLTEADGDASTLRVNSTGALHVTGAGGGTQYSVDDAGPTVVTMAGVVRDDSLTTLTEVDGDATLLRVSATGALHVTGGGGGTEYTEDIATPATQVGTATMMERDDALAGVTPVEGDWIGLRGTAEGALWTQDFNSDASLALFTTIDSDTNDIKAAVETVAAAVSTEMQVDVVAALPAGANAIGKLAANSGVDIGDVDVTSLPGSIQGPASPTIDSYANIAINLTTGANQVLVSSAPSKQIWVYGYAFSCGDAAGQSVSLQDEDDTAVTGVMEFAQYGGISVPPSGNFSMPVFKLGTDKDLEADILGGDVDGWLAYAIVSV